MYVWEPNGESTLFKEGVEMGSPLNKRSGSQEQNHLQCTTQHEMDGGSSGAQGLPKHSFISYLLLLRIQDSPGSPFANRFAPRDQPAPRLCPQQACCIPCIHSFPLSSQEQPGPGPSWVSAPASSYLALQQSHLLREEVDNELLAKSCREQVAEGGSHRCEH